ncbi:MAG TPA: YceI family protein [Flavobacteriales bacterium]|nr:YceI family protein [Flavobacteriales bacterium]
MKTSRILIIALALLPVFAKAQDRYMTRNGHVTFLSETPMENIAADNNTASSVWDATSGSVELAVLIKAFEFEKALMQEHFNENYMESNKFPKATFKGKVTGVTADQLKKQGTYPAVVEGTLTMHGVPQPVKISATVVVDASGKVTASGDFTVKAEDYKIEIPKLVRKNVAEQIKVSVRLDYQKM